MRLLRQLWGAYCKVLSFEWLQRGIAQQMDRLQDRSFSSKEQEWDATYLLVLILFFLGVGAYYETWQMLDFRQPYATKTGVWLSDGSRYVFAILFGALGIVLIGSGFWGLILKIR